MVNLGSRKLELWQTRTHTHTHASDVFAKDKIQPVNCGGGKHYNCKHLSKIYLIFVCGIFNTCLSLWVNVIFHFYRHEAFCRENLTCESKWGILECAKTDIQIPMSVFGILNTHITFGYRNGVREREFGIHMAVWVPVQSFNVYFGFDEVWHGYVSFFFLCVWHTKGISIIIIGSDRINKTRALLPSGQWLVANAKWQVSKFYWLLFQCLTMKTVNLCSVTSEIIRINTNSLLLNSDECRTLYTQPTLVSTARSNLYFELRIFLDAL